MFSKVVVILLSLLIFGCCDTSKNSAPYGFTIKKNGVGTIGSDKSKVSILFSDNKTSKQFFNLIKEFDGKDSLIFISILPPADKSMIKYLVVNDLSKRTDTLSLFYSISDCSISFESSLLNGKKGKVTTLNYGTIFDLD
jgi:hypothetical protein